MDRHDSQRALYGKQAGRYLLPGAFAAFFCIMWYVSPVGIYPDSGSYIAMQEGREPLYPLFLAFFRFVFREKDTLVWLASSGQLESEKAMELIRRWPALRVSMLAQSLFAAFSCCYLTAAIRRSLATGRFFTGLTALCTLIPYVLTPLASSSHMTLNTAVLTEGLTFPAFAVFSGCMIRGFFAREGKPRFYGAAWLWALLLVLTRNQMLVAFAVWCLVLLFELLRSRNGKYALVLALAVLLFFGGRTAAGRLYNGFFHPGYMGTDTGSYNILTTLLYLSDRSDASALSDPGERELFLEMHERMEAGEMTRAFAPEGVLGRAYHYEDYYDTIGFAIQQPLLFGYAEESGAPKEEILNEVVRIAGHMDRELMPGLLGAYLSNYLASVLNGLTRSISANGVVMGIYSAAAYLSAAALMLCLFYRDRKSRAAYLMLFALLMIIVNVSATSLMIMCLSRYMIYNTALFYIAGLLCLREWIGGRAPAGKKGRI